jgi:molybdenum cofactor sulfurtransferase
MKAMWGTLLGRHSIQSSSVTDSTSQLKLDQMDAAFEAFRKAYPAYDATHKLDTLRATDYARLDRQGHVYLDYTGGGLYAQSQLLQHMTLLSNGVYGNPHSKNLTSMAMTHLVEHAREHVLRYFNASPEEYIVIFTPNATGALKLVGESYPFGPGDTYLLTFDRKGFSPPQAARFQPRR